MGCEFLSAESDCAEGLNVMLFFSVMFGPVLLCHHLCMITVHFLNSRVQILYLKMLFDCK